MSTTTQLSENSHQGFEGLKAALCLAEMQVKSNTASGMPVSLRRNGIGSRSSGKERDAETGLDYFLARYYSGAQGRFLSPDEFKGGPDDALTGADIIPLGPLPYADIGNPQSLNKYTYVLNNPLRYVDPDGHTWAEFFEGVGDTTYRPIVQTVSHPIDAISNIASAVAHPIDTISAIGNSVVETGKGALSGDSKALGEVTGTVVSALVTAGAAKGIAALAKGSEVAEVGSGIAKSFNPFKGKSAQEVGAMFEKKGFEARGPNPIAGKGGYVNPETGRSYHIDPGGAYKKGSEAPHVDVNRPKSSNLPKRKFPLEDKP